MTPKWVATPTALILIIQINPFQLTLSVNGPWRLNIWLLIHISFAILGRTPLFLVIKYLHNNWQCQRASLRGLAGYGYYHTGAPPLAMYMHTRGVRLRPTRVTYIECTVIRVRTVKKRCLNFTLLRFLLYIKFSVCHVTLIWGHFYVARHCDLWQVIKFRTWTWFQVKDCFVNPRLTHTHAVCQHCSSTDYRSKFSYAPSWSA